MMGWLTLLAVAIAPGIAISIFIYRQDKYDNEPIKLLLKCFVAGMISAVPAVILSATLQHVLEVNSGGFTLEVGIYAFGVVGFSEELSKFAMVMFFAYYNKAFDEPFDGIVYAVMVSMGFATLENVLYTFGYGIGTGVVRMFTAVPAHATFAVIMGYYLGLAKFKPGRRMQYFMLALAGAILFHGAYDFFLMDVKNNGVYIGLGALVSLIVAIRLSFKAMGMHQYSSPFRPKIK